MGPRLREYSACKDTWEVKQTAHPIKTEFDHHFSTFEIWYTKMKGHSTKVLLLVERLDFAIYLILRPSPSSTPSRGPEAENPILRPNYLQ